MSRGREENSKINTAGKQFGGPIIHTRRHEYLHTPKLERGELDHN